MSYIACHACIPLCQDEKYVSLTLANEIGGKVIFSLVCVCSQRWGSHVTITHDASDLTVQETFQTCSLQDTPPPHPASADIWWLLEHISTYGWRKWVIHIPLECFLATARNSSFGKVMFSQACVIHSFHPGGAYPSMQFDNGVCIPACNWTGGCTPPRHTHTRTHTLLDTHTPWIHTSPGHPPSP